MHVEILLNKMKNVRHLTKSAENAEFDRIWTYVSKNIDAGLGPIGRWLGSDNTDNTKTDALRNFPK